MNIRSIVGSKPFAVAVHSLIWLALLLVPIIIDESPVARNSRIMRYMLTDSKDEKVSLAKETEYLQNFIELQRMRISDKVDIQFTTAGDPELLMIEPLLLIPFVENAFKHGVSYVEDCSINISLKIDPKELVFQVENPVTGKKEDELAVASGIGLKNIRRRLELLYTGKHKNVIDETEAKYIVRLIPCKESSPSQPDRCIEVRVGTGCGRLKSRLFLFCICRLILFGI